MFVSTYTVISIRALWDFPFYSVHALLRLGQFRRDAFVTKETRGIVAARAIAQATFGRGQLVLPSPLLARFVAHFMTLFTRYES